MLRGALALLLFILSTSLAAGAAMEELKEGALVVRFEKTGDEDQVRRFRRDVLPTVSKILKDVASDLGVSSSMQAKVNIYSPETYHQKFPHTVDTRIPAFYQTGRKEMHARADNDVNHALKSTLRHELTHLVVDTAYGRVPSWLDEGLAVMEERKISVDPKPHNIDYNTIYIANQDGKYISIKQLSSSGIFGRSHGTVRSGLAYTMAFVIVHELKEKNGMHSIQRYLKDLKKGDDPARAFQSNFGMSYEAFDQYLVETSRKKS